jgi:glycosyltransferase involved in cell wall biosynthesis
MSPPLKTPAELLVLTNTQTPYNEQFYGELARRIPLSVFYAFEPDHAGRAWQIARRDWESIGASWLTETGAIWRRRDGVAIISGDYLSSRSLMRAAVTTVTRRRYFWGERLRGGSQLRRHVRAGLFHGFDGVFAVGSWARHSYREVVRSGTPVHVLPYVTVSQRVDRRPGSEPVVGFVGSLIPRKGVDILLRALAHLDSPPRLEVIGSGPEEARLRALARDLGVRVAWLGEVDPPAVHQARTGWWLQAVPSRYDGWGVVVSESLASGVPVLASHLTGAAHDLLDGRCGELVASEEAWPDALARWLSRSCRPETTEAAARTAELLSASSASAWLLDVLADPGSGERDFLAESLGSARIS